MTRAVKVGHPTSAVPGTPRTTRFPCFDGLRAIAALSVVLFHTAFYSGFSARSSLGIYTGRLDIGVAVFFLISGFLLYRPFVVSHLSGTEPLAMGRFWVRRLLRIVPAYWVAMTLIVYVLHTESIGPGSTTILSHYSFTQIYFPTFSPAGPLSGIGQAWSLCTEMSFYLVLPLYAFLIRRTRGGIRAEWIGLVVVATIGIGFKAFVVTHLAACTTGTCGEYPDMALWLPFYLDLFAAGMFLAVASAWWTRRDRTPPLLAHPAMPWVSWGIALIVFVGVSHLGIPVAGAGTHSGLLRFSQREMYAIFAFFLLLPAVFGPQDRGGIRRFLASRAMVGLGLVSYGVYLWHQAVIHEVLQWTHKAHWASVTNYALFTIMVTGLSVAVAAISYVVVERPALRLKPRAARLVTAEGSAATDSASREE